MEEKPQDVLSLRRNKVNALRDAGYDLYPTKVGRTHSLGLLRADFKKLEKGKQRVIIVGRIMTLRTHGGISFATIRDGSGDFQVAFQEDVLGNAYAGIDDLDLGDFIEVSGTPFTTKRGEPSVSSANFRIISKALRPLPEKWHGLKDPEERYRRRYLDMLTNSETREKLLKRATLVRTLRDQLHAEGFSEIENPVLEVAASGAAAKPFSTHIDAYDLDLYLRIAVGELWQKRSLVGGFEKIYEIGRAFRNEGVDYSHNPDFTMLEYYWAYADYEDNLALHERMIPAAVEATTGSLKVPYGGDVIDFTPPYPRITFAAAIAEATGIDITSLGDIDSLAKAITAAGLKVEPGASYAKLLDDLFKNSYRAHAVQPVFVTHYPSILKPLAKRSPDYPGTAEMFQLIVATVELSNSYTELNDPEDQRVRFEEQSAMAAAGDPEAMQIDAEYIEALEYGMPPATGTGIGIDRFSALLTNSHSIREVTAYPLMKPRRSDQEGTGDSSNE
jgi:lysyl-tRNA synthetase class 2